MAKHADSTIRVGVTHEIEDGSGVIYARKLVSLGERLEIEADGQAITLDALLLEGLSWHREREQLGDIVDAADDFERDPLPLNGGEQVAGTDEITISNEYAQATVTHVDTDAGEGLRISAPGRGTSITLGPPSLRALVTVDDTYAFSTIFKTPFGPEDTPLEGPH